MSTATQNDIVLFGPPRHVTGRVPVVLSRSVLVLASITVGRETTVFRATLRPTTATSAELRLKLPAETPPGTYVGEATLDGETRRLQVRVEPVPKVSVQPRQSSISAAGAGQVEFEFVIMNEGNVPFTVPSADTFDLDDGVAQEKALGRSLRAPLNAGGRGVDAYFDQLRDAHGGEARVRVLKGAGVLAPGEQRQLRCALDIPAAVQRGRTYIGAWQLANTAHIVAADISAASRPATDKAESQ